MSISPRLPSSSTSTSRARASRTSASSARKPELPKRSKNADCGLSTPMRKSAASSTRLPNSSAPSAESGKPQDFQSARRTDRCPTHSGLCSRIFCCRRSANVGMAVIVVPSYGAWKLSARNVSTSVSRTPCAPGFLDRRGLVYDLRVVQQQRGPWLDHRKTHTRRSLRIEHARLAAAHVAAIDKDHCDIIDAVAMRTFRCRTADAFRGVDAELMRLDVPARHRPAPTRK